MAIYKKIYENRFVQVPNTHRFQRLREGYVSTKAKRYSTNNPFQTKQVDVLWTPSFLGGLPTLSLAEPEFSSKRPPPGIINRAIRKLEEKAQGSSGSQLLTAALEWDSSLRMITARAIQLRTAFRALRVFDLPRVARILGVTPGTFYNEQLVRKARFSRPTDLWLEWWMGWSPLISDIYNAVNVLQRPFPAQHIGVSVRGDENTRTDNRTAAPNQSFYVRTSSISWQYALYADAQVTNSNLYIANQLGLINPVQTAWDLIPFSFVVGWFVNLSQVIGNLNRFAGVTLERGGTAVRKKVTLERSGADRYQIPGSVPPKYSLAYYKCVGKMDWKSRDPGTIPLAQLTLEFNQLSLTRAATAVGLLTELFLAGDGKLLRK